MGIIGVVAALTIPNLNQSTGDREKVARLKKVYANFEDAYGRATAVYGPMSEWKLDDNINNLTGERVSDFFKISKTCGVDIKYLDSECIAISGDSPESDQMAGNGYKFILADGTGVSISHYGWTVNPYNAIGVVVDIDGPNKGKNSAGNDIFYFTIGDEVDDVGCNSETTGDWKNSIGDESSWGCYTQWILANNNMDYLKIDSSYKCPNGNLLNWETNTSCK